MVDVDVDGRTIKNTEDKLKERLHSKLKAQDSRFKSTESESELKSLSR